MKKPRNKGRRPKIASLDQVYIGELATPIFQPVSTLGKVRAGMISAKSGEQERAEIAAAAKQLSKIPALFAHYEIDARSEHRWFFLAIAIALSHVPGMKISFNPPPRDGRPSSSKPRERQQRLLRDTEALIAKSDKKLSITQLLTRLQRENAFWGEMKLTSLKTRYREARRYRKQRQTFKTMIEVAGLQKI